MVRDVDFPRRFVRAGPGLSTATPVASNIFSNYVTEITHFPAKGNNGIQPARHRVARTEVIEEIWHGDL